MGLKNDGATLGGETEFLCPEGGSRPLEMCIYNNLSFKPFVLVTTVKALKTA